MSVTGSGHFRLADGTMFNNLRITGDWIKTGVNAGCVEAAVMAECKPQGRYAVAPEIISGNYAKKPIRALNGLNSLMFTVCELCD